MYTDGITETANLSGDLFGEERFKAFIKEYSHLPADRFADSLLHDLAAWSGRKAGRAQEDDLTLIVVDIA
jgi:sigma-B regulation protein RsbU (phosphoserine phosphatase)